MSESSARLKIVVDTNLFVSGTIVKRGNPLALLNAWQGHAFTLLLSERQHTELVDVFGRDDIARKYQLTPEELTDLFYRPDAAPRVEPRSTIPVHLRDPKDVHILAAALGGNADYLVTGDNDLHDVAGDSRLGPLKIITVVEFLAILENRERSEEEPDDR